MTPKIIDQNAILEWSSEQDYPVSSLVKPVGGGLIYASKVASGPSSSAGPQNPSSDTNNTYWTPVCLDDNNVVHKTGDEVIIGLKTYSNGIECTGNYIKTVNAGLDFLDPPTSNDNEYLVFCDKNRLSYALIQSRVNSSYQTMRFLLRKLGDGTSSSSGLPGFGVYGNSTGPYAVAPTTSGIALGGAGSSRWSEVWAVNGSIQTSDARLKTTPESIPDEILDAWGNLDFCQFKMKDSVSKKGESNARLHTGIIAQSVDGVFSERGLDPRNYGFFCWNKWNETPEERNENGDIEQEYIPAGDEYSIRYEELLCMEAAYQRRENRRLKEKVASLEERLASLEEKLK